MPGYEYRLEEPGNFDLTPHLADLRGTCWWCGSAADSLEHRHKKSDLTRLMGPANEPLVWGSASGIRDIRGPNSKDESVRFGAVLCQACNNARSQPFDRAYSLFTDALVAGMEDWWQLGRVDLFEILGSDWPDEAVNVARYYIKNVGCLMADQGVEPPAGMRDFLDGRAPLLDVGLYLIMSESHYAGYKVMGEPASLWRPGTVAQFSPSQARITGLAAEMFVGYVGVLFDWREGSGSQDSFYHYRFPVLNVRRATAGDE